MDLKKFLESGGLRTLSLIGLKSTSSFSVVLCLLDGMLLGQQRPIENLKDLCLFLGGASEESVAEALDELMYHHIIHQVDDMNKLDNLLLELDTNKWKSFLHHKADHHEDVDENTILRESPQENLTLLSAFRERHEIYDAKVRALASDELKKTKEQIQNLTSDEQLLLQILTHHHQPRKQLHWALKVKLLYPNLAEFLEQARVVAELADPNKA